MLVVQMRLPLVRSLDFIGHRDDIKVVFGREHFLGSLLDGIGERFEAVFNLPKDTSAELDDAILEFAEDQLICFVWSATPFSLIILK